MNNKQTKTKSTCLHWDVRIVISSGFITTLVGKDCAAHAMLQATLLLLLSPPLSIRPPFQQTAGSTAAITARFIAHDATGCPYRRKLCRGTTCVHNGSPTKKKMEHTTSRTLKRWGLRTSNSSISPVITVSMSTIFKEEQRMLRGPWGRKREKKKGWGKK